MSIQIKVSVIIPVYNMEKYLQKCLDTVRGQSLQEIEILCINDGSMDDSKKIILLNAREDNRVKIIDQENRGVGAARNAGIDQAIGKYVAFMDPDDYYLDNQVLMDLYNAADNHEVMICGGSLSEDHDDGKWIRKEFLGIYTKYTFAEEGYMKYQDYQFDYGFYRFIYNREFLKSNNIYFPQYIRFQDPPFFVKAMIAAQQFYSLPRVTYCYRYGHQSLNWDETRICAVLNGFIDNLDMSKEAGLADLHSLTVDRMLREYKDKIMLGLNARSYRVFELLLKAETKIEKTFLPNDSEHKNGIIPLLYEWNDETIRNEKKKARKSQLEYENIYNSTTFKVGKSVMRFPIAIKKRIKGEKKGE